MKGFIFTVDAIFALIVAAAATSMLLYLNFSAPLGLQASAGEAQNLLQGMLTARIGQVNIEGLVPAQVSTPYLSGNNLVAQFNGSSYVSVTSPTAKLSPTSQVSVFAWIYPHEMSGCNGIVSYAAPNTLTGYALYWGYGCGPSQGTVKGFVATGSNPSAASNTPVMGTDAWNLVGVTYNGSKVCTWLNNLAPVCAAAVGSIVYGGGSFYIGRNWAGSGFSGYIANVQIYNTSLSRQSVNTLYSEGMGALPVQRQGLSAWWPLNGNSTDWTGANNGMASNVIYLPSLFERFPYLSAPLNGSVLQAIAGLYANGGTAYANLLFSAIESSSSSGMMLNGSFAPSLSAARFNGQSSYVSMPPYLSPTQLQGNGITISAWINTTATSIGAVAGQRHDACSYYCNGGMEVNYASNSVSMLMYNNTVYAAASSTSRVNDGRWHHVVGTYNGTYLSVYVDGVKEGSAYAGQTYSSGPNSSIIGVQGMASGKTFYFNGSIADVQMYNTSLSSAQVTALYLEGMGGPPLQGHLMGWWPLGNDAIDYSQHHYSGMATGVSFAQAGYLPSSLLGAYSVSKASLPMLVGSNGIPSITNVSVVVWR